MAEFEPRLVGPMDGAATQARTAGTQAQTYDAGLRAYMLGVYNYMAIGVALTGLVAWLSFRLAAVETAQGIALTAFGAALFQTPLIWVAMLAPLGLVFFLSFRIHKMSAGAAQTTFWVYAALVGLSLSCIFISYEVMSVAKVFFITAAAFGALSLYGYTTKRDLSAMGSFLIMGLFGLIIAMVVNMFLGSAKMDFVISGVGVLIFAGLTAWDTQRIKELYNANDGQEMVVKKSVLGALALYLDFLNMFLFLLRFFGVARD